MRKKKFISECESRVNMSSLTETQKVYCINALYEGYKTKWFKSFEDAIKHLDWVVNDQRIVDMGEDWAMSFNDFFDICIARENIEDLVPGTGMAAICNTWSEFFVGTTKGDVVEDETIEEAVKLFKETVDDERDLRDFEDACSKTVVYSIIDNPKSDLLGCLMLDAWNIKHANDMTMDEGIELFKHMAYSAIMKYYDDCKFTLTTKIHNKTFKEVSK